MTVFLGLVGIVCSVVIITYRERTAEMIGAADWMEYLGGVYNVVILVGILLFFFSVAALTGTLGLFLSPIRLLLPTPVRDTTLDMP